MLSLIIRNLIFTILQPGLVVGLIPYFILGGNTNDILEQLLSYGAFQIIGALVCLVGLTVMIHCIVRFAIKGRGTLSPADPTKKLVVSGLYKFSRNPMYVGVVLILIGEALFFQSIELGVYSLIVFVGFNFFAMLIEEPRLRRDFGMEYVTYCKKVRRWL